MAAKMLLNNSCFSFEKELFFQKSLFRNDTFERKYIELRKREQRVYADHVLQLLPEYGEGGPLKKEWAARKITTQKIIKYLRKKSGNISILELGCGNGWLSHQLALSLNAEIVALDINETEMLQGATLFKDVKNLSFVYADIFTASFEPKTFDVILLASSIQYFSHLEQLIRRLLELLKPSGEIHIVDSPFYNSAEESAEAKKRSRDYFNISGVPEMEANYFHHTFSELKSFHYQILFTPNSLISLLQRKILNVPHQAFPWILIKHP